MKVTNLKSPRSGSPVANQYEITGDDGAVTFQSYETPIAVKRGYHYTISADWCYSVTTSKYFSAWLRDWGWYDSEIAELKKWLKKPRKDGDQVAILSPSNIEVTYVEELK